VNKIVLNLKEEEASYLAQLKKKRDELVVPLEKWKEHIEDNSRIEKDDIPDHLLCGEFVITEREWFSGVVYDLGYLYFQPTRLTKEQGGFWFVEKLEKKVKADKKDIFDVHKRVKGSFRSNQ